VSRISLSATLVITTLSKVFTFYGLRKTSRVTSEKIKELRTSLSKSMGELAKAANVATEGARRDEWEMQLRRLECRSISEGRDATLDFVPSPPQQPEVSQSRLLCKKKKKKEKRNLIFSFSCRSMSSCRRIRNA
jgi:hypothetical protein